MESPLFTGRAAPNGRPMMTIGRERAAFRAYQWLKAFGADVRPTHRLPNGLGYFAPGTGRYHGARTECGTLLCVGPKETRIDWSR